MFRRLRVLCLESLTQIQETLQRDDHCCCPIEDPVFPPIYLLKKLFIFSQVSARLHTSYSLVHTEVRRHRAPEPKLQLIIGCQVHPLQGQPVCPEWLSHLSSTPLCRNCLAKKTSFVDNYFSDHFHSAKLMGLKLK